MKLTIGVMAKAPVPGHCKTRLAAAIGDARAADLCRAMLLDTLDAITRDVRADRFVVMAAPEQDGVAALRALAPARWEIVVQEGRDLGERLTRAMSVLSAADTAVALVDADSPTAPWDEAGRALSRFAGPLMGPCSDGGYWLIALAAPEPRVFESITWSTPLVAGQTRERCAALGLGLAELPIAHDVDEPADLDRLRESVAQHPERAPRTAAFFG
jgi:rSAM/selenodomain-associated transferase 1